MKVFIYKTMCEQEVQIQQSALVNFDTCWDHESYTNAADSPTKQSQNTVLYNLTGPVNQTELSGKTELTEVKLTRAESIEEVPQKERKPLQFQPSQSLISRMATYQLLLAIHDYQEIKFFWWLKTFLQKQRLNQM